jgi:hypothetical protein
MNRASWVLVLPLALALGACASKPLPVADSGPPLREPMYVPSQVKPGRLEYAPDRSTFAPVLTERFPYPTQLEANSAYRRLLATAPTGSGYPASLWLFGCKPGALDAHTARVTRYHRPVVHCATDFLGADGRRVRRETANFYYYAGVWNMQAVYPPRSAVAWRDRERSPKDFWWWLPGRDRYE